MRLLWSWRHRCKSYLKSHELSGFSALVGFFHLSQRWRALITQNGTYMLIDGNSPIALSNRQKNDKLFEDLESGDKVWVLHDGIEETYPARTGAYAVRKLEIINTIQVK